MNRYTLTLNGKETVVYMIDHVLRFCKNNGHSSLTYADLYKPNVDEFEIGNITIRIERNI